VDVNMEKFTRRRRRRFSIYQNNSKLSNIHLVWCERSGFVVGVLYVRLFVDKRSGLLQIDKFMW
jgi:hypothetical protein